MVLSIFSIHLLSLAIVGVGSGLPINFRPTAMPIEFFDSLRLLQLYSDAFKYPILGVGTIFLYMNFGFVVLVSLITWVATKKSVNIAILLIVAVFIVNFLGFTTGWYQIVPYLFFSNYFVFHHSFFVNGLTSFVFIVAGGLFVITNSLGLISVGGRDNSSLAVNEFLIRRKYYLVSAIIIFMLLAINVLKSIRALDVNLIDSAINMVFGSNLIYPSFLNYMQLVIINFTPLFFVGLSMANMRRVNITPMLLRYRDKRRFNSIVHFTYQRYLLLYYVGILFLLLAIFVINKDIINSSDYGTIVNGTGVGFIIFNLLVGLSFLISSFFSYAIFSLVSAVANEFLAFITLFVVAYLDTLIDMNGLKLFGIGVVDVLRAIDGNWQMFLMKLAGMMTIVFSFNFIIFKGGHESDRIEKCIEEI